MNRQRTLNVCLLAAITLLAAFLRLYQIDSLPPSAGYDQAAYGLDVLDILDGARPVFLPTNFGREALFSYLVTLVYLILGDVSVAVYVTSALIGVLTVPATYLAAEELFAVHNRGRDTSRSRGRGIPMSRTSGTARHVRARFGNRGYGLSLPAETDASTVLARWGGLLAALALALSRWHQSWSRLGMRAILVPLFAALTVWLLWRGLRTGSLWAFVGCGLTLGLSLHTYQAARALPLLVLLGYAYVAWSRKRFTRRDVLNLALIALVALIVFAPLGIYFLTHPGSAGLRIEQAAVVDASRGARDTLRVLFEQGRKAARTLFLVGDEDARVNVYGWPALNPFFSLTLALGLLIALVRLKRPAYALLLTWLTGLSAPAILARYGPITKRALGATPAVAMLVAIGCLVPYDALVRWTGRRFSTRTRGPGGARVRFLGGALLLSAALLQGAGFVYSGVQTYRHYFRFWATDINLFTHFEVGKSAIGRYLKDRPPEERVYISPVPVDHPSVAVHSERRPGVKSYHGKHCFVAVDGAPVEATYVIVPAEDANSLPLLETLLPQGQIADEGPLHYGQPYFLAYRVPAGARANVSPDYVRKVEWVENGGAARLRLLGYDLDSVAFKPGETLHLTLYYGALGEGNVDPVTGDYTAFVHLLGPHNPATGGSLWAQDDSEPCRRSYRTSAWGPNEIVVDRYTMTIPLDAPAGEYAIEMGFYQWDTMVRLSVLDATGQAVGDHTILTVVYVTGT